MLGRKTYAREELDHGKAIIERQLATYNSMVRSIADQGALRAFEGAFCNTLILALDRLYVHRLRVVTGKDGNPLNEVELLCESLLNNDGVFRGNSVVRYDSEQSVLTYKVGDTISLSAGEFEQLATAFFQELERRFLEHDNVTFKSY